VSAPGATELPQGPSDQRQAGDAYEHYMGRWSRLVAGDFVAWLGISPGGVWLDVGCGTAALTRAIGALAAPLAVSGVDHSAGMLAYAGGVADDELIDLQLAEATQLPYEDGIFDVVVSGLVLDELPDPVSALREQSRVLAPHGVVAAYVWDYAEGMRLLRSFWDVARGIKPSAAAIDEASRSLGARPRNLVRTFVAAGLDPIESRTFEVMRQFRDFTELWTPFLSGQGAAPGFVAGLTTDELEALRAGLLAALPVEPDGTIRLPARAWAVRARA
jgi:ubiquinone/menaquinone biosynthesis C-methylase UbiE